MAAGVEVAFVLVLDEEGVAGVATAVTDDKVDAVGAGVEGAEEAAVPAFLGAGRSEYKLNIPSPFLFLLELFSRTFWCDDFPKWKEDPRKIDCTQEVVTETSSKCPKQD